MAKQRFPGKTLQRFDAPPLPAQLKLDWPTIQANFCFNFFAHVLCCLVSVTVMTKGLVVAYLAAAMHQCNDVIKLSRWCDASHRHAHHTKWIGTEERFSD